MNNRKQLKAGLILSLCCMLIILMMPLQSVMAASSAVSFGSTSYSAKKDEQLRVGVYIRSDEIPGTYHVELAYDTSRLTYVSGADGEKDGIITLEGTATGKEIKYMLYFTPTSGGNAGIIVSEARVYGQDGAEMTITSTAQSPIIISGQDSTGGADYDYAIPEEDTAGQPVRVNGIPVVGVTVDGDGNDLYIVDLDTYEKEGHELNCDTVTGELGEKEVVFLTDADQNVRLLYLMTEAGQVSLYSCGEDEIFYECGVDGEVCYVSPYSVTGWPSGMTEEMVRERGIVYRIDGKGKGTFCRTDTAELINWDEEAEEIVSETEGSEIATESQSETENKGEETTVPEKKGSSLNLTYVIYGGIALAAILLLLLIIVPVVRRAQKRKKAKAYVATLPPENGYVEPQKKDRRNSPKKHQVVVIPDREEDTKTDEAAGAEDDLSAKLEQEALKEFTEQEEKRDPQEAEEVTLQDPVELMEDDAAVLTGIAEEIADMKASMDNEALTMDFEETEFAFDDTIFSGEDDDSFLADFEKSLEEALNDLEGNK